MNRILHVADSLSLLNTYHLTEADVPYLLSQLPKVTLKLPLLLVVCVLYCVLYCRCTPACLPHGNGSHTEQTLIYNY